MKPNVTRILHAIAYLIGRASERKETVTQYDIVKSIFLADRAHLNRYGRPITFDNYVAMKFGPVPSLVYDFLKENRQRMHRVDISSLPWTRRPAPDLGETCFAYENSKLKPSDDVLSPSDMDELDKALTVVKALGFHQIKKLTHGDPAYIDAWDGESERNQFPMSYALLFDSENIELAKELAFLSENL